MPTEALPQSWSKVKAAPTRIRRGYPGVTKGRVTITGLGTFALEDGVLDVEAPPGTYELVAALRHTDGSTTTDTATVVVS